MSKQTDSIVRLTSLFLGMFLLQFGQMMLGMGLAIKVPELYAEGTSGLILSVFSLGLIVGAVRSRDLIERFGHIRSFAAFATIMSATVVFHALVEDPIMWLALRLVAGVCFGGLIAIFESWISDAAEPETRGFVVGFYQFVSYSGHAIGMLMVNFIDIDGPTVFLIASVVLSVSLVPIVLTRVIAPTPDPFQPKGLGELFAVSPLALSGAIGSGLIFGMLYVLTSIYMAGEGFQASTITFIYVAFVMGGMAFQVPLAFVADRVDRRVALLTVFLGILAACVGAMVRVNTGASPRELIVWFFMIGGATAMVYPIALARAYDFLKPEKYVAAASAMIMSYSAAAFIGPVVGGFVMERFGNDLFLPMMVAMAGFMALFTVYRMVRGENLSIEEQEDIVVMPTRLSSTAGLSLDPRTPDANDQLGEGEEDLIADNEMMGERYDPTQQ